MKTQLICEFYCQGKKRVEVLNYETKKQALLFSKHLMSSQRRGLYIYIPLHLTLKTKKYNVSIY